MNSYCERIIKTFYVMSAMQVVGNFTCEILEKAIKRYLRIISSAKDRRKHNRSKTRVSTAHNNIKSWQTDPFYEVGPWTGLCFYLNLNLVD